MPEANLLISDGRGFELEAIVKKNPGSGRSGTQTQDRWVGIQRADNQQRCL